MTTSPRAPVVHMNGTSKKDLVDQLWTAFDAGRAFQNALVETRPNARDYYVAGDTAFVEANAQHAARLTRVSQVMDELAAIAAAVEAQGR